ncbi:MAG: hypothetical protein HC884_07810 [Chloroflexaceae bacterium]|nr:hypothetical protein [Chloroflexaceae bacterium]
MSTETCARLDRYRGFRHVVRNLYAFELDPQQIQTLVEGLQPAMEQVSQELAAFAQFLERTAGEAKTI